MVVADVPPSGEAPGGPGGPAGPVHDKDATRTNVAQSLRDSQALASSRMLTSPAGRTPPLRTPKRDVRHAAGRESDGSESVYWHLVHCREISPRVSSSGHAGCFTKWQASTRRIDHAYRHETAAAGIPLRRFGARRGRSEGRAGLESEVRVVPRSRRSGSDRPGQEAEGRGHDRGVLAEGEDRRTDQDRHRERREKG